jgi:hypothetical protein
MTVLLPVKELFGGAIRMGVPPQWTDVSDLRQVPDNQEVWCYQQCSRSSVASRQQQLLP